MKLTIRELTRIIRGQLILGDPRAIVSGATVDSRVLRPGQAFVALKGERSDGHDFAMSACRTGAAAVIVSHLDWLHQDPALKAGVIRVPDAMEALRQLAHSVRSGFRGPVVGITGSNGKTTTKQMIAGVLGTKGPGLATAGNFNSQIGLPLVLADLDSSHQWMALEMGASAPGNIAALAEIARPTLGVITSIGPAHLATFGSVQRIAESKWELMEALPLDGVAIVPWGEPTLEPHVRRFTKRIVFFGEDASCPVRAAAVELGETVSFLLHVGTQNARVRLGMPGRINVSNALAAAATGWALGYGLPEIVRGLETFEPPKMRMEVLHHPSGAVVINDAYNANPASMIHSIRSLVESYPNRHHVVVAGSMLELGEESEKFHFHLGAELARFSLDHVFLVGDEMKPAMEGATSAGAKAGRFETAATADGLASRLKSFLQKDTVILFKGSRGVHLERAIDGLGSLRAPAKAAS